MAPSGADDLIYDQNHGGTTGFIWLAPVVKGAVVSADFNDGYSPEVVICEWDAGANDGEGDCATPQSTGFPLTIPATTEVDQYQALWDTKSPEVALTPTVYRATVRVGPFELGSADFEFGATGGEVKNLTTDETIGLKEGRTMPLNFTITTEFDGPCTVGLDCRIAPAGPGESLIITRDGDAAIYIPAGTLPVNATVVIEEKVGEDCVLNTSLPWYNSCYTYDIVDEAGEDVEFNPGTFVIVEQCLAEDEVPPSRIDEVQLGAQHADPGEPSDFELLPSADSPATLSCDDYVPGPNPTGLAAVMDRATRGLKDLFLGESLYALDKGLGGRAGDLSTVAFVDPGLRVASFDGTRGGFLSINSDALGDARAALQTMADPLSYSTLWIDVGPTLTEDLLDSHVDVAIVGTVFGNSSAISPLSESERDALEHFVLDGGCVVLLPDNSTFDANAEAVNESLIDAFGLDISGTLTGSRYPTIVDGASPLIDGPFGTVTSIRQNYPGWFDGFPEIAGVEVNTVATVGDGAAAVTIAPWVHDLVSNGRVIAFSDANMFFGSGFSGFFGTNDTLFRNTIAACDTEPLYIPPVIE